MLQFRIQSTPNPLARKYVLSQDLKREGKVSYQQANQCQHVPLANALLHNPDVLRCSTVRQCRCAQCSEALDRP